MLDLSATFDTLDQTLLLGGASSYFGIFPHSAKWFSSYLTGRTQSTVIIGNIPHLVRRRLEFGVPQGSILGPLLFTLYKAPIQNIISALRSVQMILNDAFYY